MPTPQSGFSVNEERLGEAILKSTEIFLANDGILDAVERYILSLMRESQKDMIRGEKAMNNGISAIRTWEPIGSDRSRRSIREMERDLSGQDLPALQPSRGERQLDTVTPGVPGASRSAADSQRTPEDDLPRTTRKEAISR